MKRNVGFIASCSMALGLSACGGGLQSPDFEGVLNGVVIEEVAANTLTVDVGATLPLRAFGLYTLPPGASDGEPCGEFRCTRGDAPGVVWSVSGQDATFATVSTTGVVRGLKRKPPTASTTGLGRVEITARIGDLPADTANVTVDGEVLQSLVFTPSSLSGSTLLPVPVGITQPVAIQGRYSIRGQFAGSGDPRDIISETINWSINDTAFARLGSATGVSNTIVGVRETVTPKPTLTVRATNLEGDPVGTVPAAYEVTISPPVITGLDSIRSDKDSIEIGESLQLTAVGRLSDGTTRDLVKVDGTNENELVGFIANGASVDGGAVASVDANTGLASGLAVGTSTVTAQFRNNVIGETFDSGIVFSTSPATATKSLAVTDRICQVQFVSGAASATRLTATATGSEMSAGSCGVNGSCRVTNPGNAITEMPLTDSANFQFASPGGLIAAGYTLNLTVNGTTVVPASAGAPRRIGLVIGLPDTDAFSATRDLQLFLLNGTTETRIPNNQLAVSSTIGQVGGFNQVLLYADVTAPFTGIVTRLPVQSGLPLFDALLSLLGVGTVESYEVPVFQVCPLARLPTTAP